MSKNATIFIAEQLIKQVENESPESLMWFLSAINRFLLTDETTTLLEFKRKVAETCPDSFNSFVSIMKIKGLKIVE